MFQKSESYLFLTTRTILAQSETVGVKILLIVLFEVEQPIENNKDIFLCNGVRTCLQTLQKGT